ncbi:skin secretory protein xP2-like [Rhinatrema bivittatum]|uniref:skin secretory protein xP2-like n=1 Tax=Rhinatrema bivittatum TaxID=194408 RepID=UPI00112BA754|nr:skin secretory protein xP2-like [Rhinatrema bivittatum]
MKIPYLIQLVAFLAVSSKAEGAGSTAAGEREESPAALPRDPSLPFQSLPTSAQERGSPSPVPSSSPAPAPLKGEETAEGAGSTGESAQQHSRGSSHSLPPLYGNRALLAPSC